MSNTDRNSGRLLTFLSQNFDALDHFCEHKYRQCDIERIEKVQRQFTKRLYGFKHLCYEEHLTKLGIPSLELRRLYLDLTYCYKIVFGLVTFNMTDFFEFSQFTGTRGHAYKLYKPRIVTVLSE